MTYGSKHLWYLSGDLQILLPGILPSMFPRTLHILTSEVVARSESFLANVWRQTPSAVIALKKFLKTIGNRASRAKHHRINFALCSPLLNSLYRSLCCWSWALHLPQYFVFDTNPIYTITIFCFQCLIMQVYAAFLQSDRWDTQLTRLTPALRCRIFLSQKKSDKSKGLSWRLQQWRRLNDWKD